ncbi:MBL fold metallo-hydrolase [uncultured Brevundimonas sp.]|uniref:MBL fold metallo-hydrolase n=1 Tax=uncultured Brevundimonas sp. TaxID=213418 RepID=UPI0030ECC305|tara:strand:+ start:85946 stop:87571 length:1626 start_codon:yes stop_codon:yes gene_type:complete
MTLSLSFHGAAGCVTGFCALLQTDHGRFLVDCGMFQGPKTLRALNHQDFPFDARDIDGVFLTHAHIDHSGMLPKLVRAGFRGPIYATRPTRDLCAVMLADSADIQEGDVAHLNRRNERRGLPRVEPIYSSADVEPTLRLFETVKFNETVEIVPGVTARYWAAGHLLGAASVELTIEDQGKPVRLLFSGDLGSGHQPFLPAPDGPAGVDHVVLESTYGDRDRADLDLEERRKALAGELRSAKAAGGPLLMPTFAVGRAQELILDLLAVMEAEPDLAGEIFLDSPLAIEATDVFLQRGWNMDASENPYLVLRHADRLHYLMRPQESDRLDRLRDWHIILAGSGMCDAGRIRKHLKRLLWRRETTVLITGFQAAGTLGRILQASPSQVRIQGDDIRVHARIRTLDLFSGHADAPALVDWFKARGPVSGKVFLAHGEPGSLQGLSTRLITAGVDAAAVIIPELDQTFTLTPADVTLVSGRAVRMLPGAATRPDWHSARADLLSSMNEALQGLESDAARMAAIAAMKTALLQSPPDSRPMEGAAHG